MMALEMQATGRDDAEKRLQRRKGDRRLRGLSQPRALPALHIDLELRRFAIAVGGHALTQAGGVRRQVQDIRVAPFGRHRIALRADHGCGQTGRRGGKGIANEMAPAVLGLGPDASHAGCVEEALGRFAHPPRRLLMFMTH